MTIEMPEMRQWWIVLERGDYLGLTFLVDMCSVALPCAPCSLLVGAVCIAGSRSLSFAGHFGGHSALLSALCTAAGLTAVQWGAEGETWARYSPWPLWEVTVPCSVPAHSAVSGQDKHCWCTMWLLFPVVPQVQSLQLDFSSDVAAPGSDTVVA